VAERLRDQHGPTHDTAARALVLWATKDNVPALIEALGHGSNTVRASALDALGNLKDVRAIAPVAAQLRKGNRQEASKALQRMGSMAEREVSKYLGDKDAVRVEACRILQVIGTKESVAALEAVRDQDRDNEAKAAAKDALAAIHALGEG
jgi:HEAT repeat protein